AVRSARLHDRSDARRRRPVGGAGDWSAECIGGGRREGVMITTGRLTSLESMLAGDHDRLDRAFDRIVTRAYGGDFQQIEAEWTAFQNALLAHLDAEERHLFPALAKDRPVEAQTLYDDHRRI